MKKKVIITVLSLVLALGLFSMVAYAAEEAAPDAPVGESIGYGVLGFAVYNHIMRGVAAVIFCAVYRRRDQRIASAPQRTQVPAQQPTARPAPATPDPAEIARRKQQQEAARLGAEQFTAVLCSIPGVPITPIPNPPSRTKLNATITPKISNITRATRIDNLFPLVVIDIETTGLKYNRNEIIEVSAIKYDKGFVPVSSFSTLVNPRKKIDEDSIKIHHITDDMVADKPCFQAILPGLSEFIAGCNIVGHNVSFDVEFLYYNNVIFEDKIKFFDTLALARRVLRNHMDESGEDTRPYVANYKLPTLCAHYGIYPDKAHSSLSDCLATGMLFERLLQDKVGLTTAEEGADSVLPS